MNLRAIRDKGIALGLVGAEQSLSDEDAMQLILEPGFSTAGLITQQAGRGAIGRWRRREHRRGPGSGTAPG